MASISISASFQRACSSYHVTKRHQLSVKSVQSIGITQENPVVSLNIEGQKEHNLAGKQNNGLQMEQGKDGDGKSMQSSNMESSSRKFSDERWKNGTWDLNIFVKNGKMDWEGVIVAESGRRKFLELYPEASTNDEPVLFRTSIIPWWAWLQRSYLPEAELLNGRAAMVGFFMAYLIDGLTGMDVVGQTGNFICKAGLFVTVISVVLFRKTKDFENLKNLADEATLYDKQWQSSWQDQNGKNI